MVEETEEEEEEEEEEEGLEYVTDTPLRGSYTTPLSTKGLSTPSLAPSHLPTLGDSDPENNAVLRTEELEAVRVLCCYPINPGRLSNQFCTGADRCTPTLPR